MRKNYRKKKFNKKRKSTYKIFFLILVGMTVGFAAINTTLQLIGTLNIAKTTWNIHFENPTKTGGVTATKEVALKENDNTTVEYQVKLTNPGDYYEFTVDAKNDGTIDGMITNISNKVYENNVEVTLPAYLESTITYVDGTPIEPNHLLASTKKETYKVKVAYKTGLAADQLPDQEKTYNFRFTVTYMQADEATSKNRLITLPAGKNKNNLEVGDEICIKEECFNFLHYEGTNDEDIVMLAKWNLNVGNNPKGTATNKQDSDVKGYVSSGTMYGNVAFSATNYWDDNGSPKSDYPGAYYPGPNYPTVYDPVNYKTEPDFSATCDNSTNCYYTPGYSVAYYVEAYKDILSSYGTTIKDARLLTYVEAIDSSIGCSGGSCPTDGFITNTSFWLGSANRNRSVWSVYSVGYFNYGGFVGGDFFGVRPVVVISKSNI